MIVKNSKMFKGGSGLKEATKFYSNLAKDKNSAKIIAIGSKLYAEFGNKVGLKLCKQTAIEDNMLNSIYIVSSSALNEESIPAITGRYSLIEYIYEGIFCNEYVEEEEPQVA